MPSSKRRILRGALVFAGFLTFSWIFFGWIPGRDAILETDYLRLVPPWKVPGATVHNPTLTDPLWQLYPWQLEFRRAIFSGRFPLWDPSISAGVPIAANPQAAYFFPLTWLVLPFGIPAGMSLAVILRPALAAFFAFLYFRRVGYGRFGAVFGALTFGFSLPFLVWAEHPHDNAFLILPLLLLAIERVLRHSTPRSIALLATAGALLGLSGHPESAFFVAAIGAVYATALWMGSGAVFSRARSAVGLLVSTGAALLISLFALVPSVLAILKSTAWKGSEHFAVALPFRTIPLLFFPDFYGNPSRGTPFTGIRAGFSEAAIFPGVLALALLLPGLRRPTRRILFWLSVISTLGFLMFLAPRLPGFTAIPVLGRSFLTRLSVPACFGVGAIAGRAIDGFDSSGFGRRWRLAVILVASAAAAAAIVFRSPVAPLSNYLWAAALLAAAALLPSLGAARLSLAVAAICALQAVDLWRAAAGFHPRAPIASIYPEFSDIGRLRREIGSGRLLAIGATLFPNSATVYGLRDVRGFDALETASYRSAREPLAQWSSDPHLPTMTAVDLSVASASRFSLFAVHAVVLPPGLEVSGPAQKRLGLRLAPSIHGRSIWIQSLENPTSRAQALFSVLPAGPESSLEQRHFDPRIASRVEGIAAPTDFPRLPPPELDFLRDDPENVAISSRSSGPFLLRLSDSYDPGWTASFDGKATRLYRCDDSFRGVFVPAGEHRIEMRYRLPGMPLTGIISALATAIVLVCCLVR